LSAAATVPRRITLTWKDNATNETGFVIERSLDSQVGFALIATVPANTTRYTDDTMISGTNHHYRIRSVGAPMLWSLFTPVVTAAPHAARP
jgi:hypothetical protein